MINKIPVYKMVVNLNDDDTGMLAISLVDEPAIDVLFQAFAKEKEPMKFSIADESEHKVTGVAIYADKYIYRWNESLGDYYVYFDRQTIENIVEKYSKENLLNSVDLQHDGEMVDGVTMIEYYIKDSSKGINPKGFEDVSDGSLFVTYKVRNDEVWKRIKDGDVRGFSIEICTDSEFVSMIQEEVFGKKKEQTFDEWIESFLPEKKKFDRELKTPVTVDIAETARKGKKQVKVNGVLGQIYSVGRKDGKANLIFQDNEGKWSVIELDDIKEMVQTDLSLVDWNYKDKTYQDIIEDEDNVINPTAVTTEDKISDAILNGRVVMLSYNDELEGAATGYRQCFVSSWGTTVRDNGCLRVYEYYGATRSGFNEGHWRLLLTRRIMDFRLMTEVEPITQAPPQYNQEAKAGSGKNGTMNEVIMVSPL